MKTTSLATFLLMSTALMDARAEETKKEAQKDRSV